MINIKVYKGDKIEDNEYVKTYSLNHEQLKEIKRKSKILYPKNSLYPSNNLYPINIEYKDTLYINEEGVYRIDRYIHINEYGGYKIEHKEEYGRIENFKLWKGINTIIVDNERTFLKMKYVKENPYSTAIKASVKNEIKVTSTEIKLEMSKKVGEEEIISKINQSPEEISIKANKISLEGTITANGDFKITEDGSMECRNATINGDLITNKGIYTTFTFPNTKQKRVDVGNYWADSIKGLYIQTAYASPLVDPVNKAQQRYDHSAIRLSGFVPNSFEIEEIRVAVKHNSEHYYNVIPNNNEREEVAVGNVKGLTIYKDGELYNNGNYQNINAPKLENIRGKIKDAWAERKNIN